MFLYLQILYSRSTETIVTRIPRRTLAARTPFYIWFVTIEVTAEWNKKKGFGHVFFNPGLSKLLLLLQIKISFIPC